MPPDRPGALRRLLQSVNLDLVPEAVVGDYVMVHAGFAISRVDAEEAERAFDTLRAMHKLEPEGQASTTRPGRS